MMIKDKTGITINVYKANLNFEKIILVNTNMNIINKPKPGNANPSYPAMGVGRSIKEVDHIVSGSKKLFKFALYLP